MGVNIWLNRHITAWAMPNAPTESSSNTLSMPETSNLLALTAIGPEREGQFTELARAILDRGCEIVECRLAHMGASFTASLVISGNWSTLGRLETALPPLAERLALKLNFHRTETAPAQPSFRPYAVEVVAPRRSDLMTHLLAFFDSQEVRVREVMVQDYASGYTSAEMTNIHLVVQVPIDQHPQALRDAFMDLCDELSADGMFDPIKS
jgi:glycine cleavage system transcriptional repressor